MKLYSLYKKASMSMSKDEHFLQLLAHLFEKYNIEYIIETGTFLGLGSTLSIIKSFPQGKSPKIFYTCEARKKFYLKAKQNLAAYPFVKVLWAKSVNTEKAIAFIQDDDAINQHENYPNIFIDDIDNPVEFYSNEMAGKLAMGPINRIKNFFDREKPDEAILERLLEKHKNDKPLVVLDSAAGIGLLEFQTTMKILQKQEFFLLLDDIHHLKHFRSFEFIQKNSDFDILGYDLENGWALAHHLKK